MKEIEIDDIFKNVNEAEEFRNGKPHTVPNPGSDAARALGCVCPVLDNAHGQGDGPFWIVGSCTIHSYVEWVLPYISGEENDG